MSKYKNSYNYNEGDIVGELIYLSKEPSNIWFMQEEVIINILKVNDL